MANRWVYIGLLIVGLSFLFLLEPITVGASAALVQQNNDGSPGCISLTVSFVNPVASGDVIVVGVGSDYDPSAVSDSLVSSFTLAATSSSSGVMFANVYYATVGGAGGADQVTVSFAVFSPSVTVGVYIYEVSGVTTAGATSATGFGRDDTVSGFSTSTSTSASFQSGAFLLGEVAIGTLPAPPFNAGGGFTASIPGATTDYSNAEYSVSGVSSSTNFPASYSGLGFGGLVFWAEAGIALNPPAPIPEYPLGLPILAIFMIIAYAVIKRRTGNSKVI